MKFASEGLDTLVKPIRFDRYNAPVMLPVFPYYAFSAPSPARVLHARRGARAVAVAHLEGRAR